MQDDLDPELLQALDEAQWMWASTCADTHPHGSVLRVDYPWLHAQMDRAIAEDGVDCPFRSGNYRHLEIGDYQYWILGCVLNRTLGT